MASGPAQSVVPSSKPGFVNRFWEKMVAPEKKSIAERRADKTMPVRLPPGIALGRLGIENPERGMEKNILPA